MSRQVNPTTVQPRRTGFALRLHEALGDTTSEAFARRIDRSLRTVQRWRSGESKPTGSDLVLIAKALGRDPAWFFSTPEPDLPEAA